MAFCVLHAIHHAIGKVGAESKAKNETHVHVCDIYPNTLEVGKQHAHKLGDLFIPASICSILEEESGDGTHTLQCACLYGQHWRMGSRSGECERLGLDGR